MPLSDKRYFLPTKPYSPIDLINQRRLATGSALAAVEGEHRNFNGHHNVLEYNQRREYWIGRYTWAGEHVFTREPKFEHALGCAISQYNSQGTGASLWVWTETEEDEKLCLERGLQLYTEEACAAETAKWWTWKHDAAREVVNSLMPNLLIPLLMKAETKEEWEKARDGVRVSLPSFF